MKVLIASLLVSTIYVLWESNRTTALKTIGMRLRSTKTELGAAGEDTDGAAESVSKLREEILALSGVDIQASDSSYKDTYTVLKEISQVWGQISDLGQASILELLFGKRQNSLSRYVETHIVKHI